jgi:hypothetical protein
MQLRLLAALAFVSLLACSDPLEPEGERVAPSLLRSSTPR